MAFKSTRKTRRLRNKPQEKRANERAFFQPKLKVGAANDKYEQEADAVADRVVSGSADGTPAIQAKVDSRMEEDRAIQEKRDPTSAHRGAGAGSEADYPVEPVQVQRTVDGREDETVQRQPSEEEEPVQMMGEEEEPVQMMGEEEEEAVQMQAEAEEEPLQMMGEEEEEPIQMQGGEKEEPIQAKAVAAAAPRQDLGGRLRERAGKGRPLAGRAKNEMETGFGHDFSDVNIHTDQAADEMNRELGARAFARGRDVYFKAGEFNPDTTAGKRLLAHELTHTIQQGGGAAKGKGGAPAVQRNWDKTSTTPTFQDDTLHVKVKLEFSGAVLNKSANAALNTAGLASTAKRQIERSFRGKIKKNLFYGLKVVYDVTTTASIRVINKLSDLKYGEEHLLVVLDDTHPKVTGVRGRGPFYGSIIYLNEKHVGDMLSGANEKTIPHEAGHTAGLKHLLTKKEEAGMLGPLIRQWYHAHQKDNLMWRGGGGHPSYSSTDAKKKLTDVSGEQLQQVTKNINQGKLNKTNLFSLLFLMN